MRLNRDRDKTAVHSLLAPALVLAATACTAVATERRFTFVQETTTAPKGAVEFENWFTWKRGTPEDTTFDRLEFRHEVELGLTDHVQLSFYLADWSYTDGRTFEKRDHVKYDDSAVELKVEYASPVDGLGIASYHEFRMGDEVIELENKLILQKNVGPWLFAYNLTIEAVWEEHGYRQREGEISQALGASDQFTPRLLAGVEAVHEFILPNWHAGGPQNFFVGPVASHRFGGEHDLWLTATALRQLTHTPDEPSWQFRLILGMTF